MAAANPASSSGPQQQPNQQSHNSDNLRTWWSGFKRRGKGKETAPAPAAPVQQGIFGVPLQDSIKYANVAISLLDENGQSFIYGYVPIVVAKCGVFLKEKATDVEGIFRLSGSEKRIKELQIQFDTPSRYGKGLDWTGYTVHDAANVLRRYINRLPQPIVPLEAYEKFREPLRNHQSQAVGNTAPQTQETGNFDHEGAIKTFQKLIKEMPPLNRQLLLYILDLMSVFASKSDINRMTSANLAAIFQPGVLRHPMHDMTPQEYLLSQDVLIFLIDNQDSFLFGMDGTAADERTVQEVQSGAPTPQAGTPTRTSQSGLGRSASSASASTDSQKRLGNIRRNLSVSSRGSRNSPPVLAPNTPQSNQFAASSSTSGVYRSNTVPSKKSPALSSRMARGMESPNTPIALSPALVSPSAARSSSGSRLAPAPAVVEPTQSISSSTTPTNERPSMGVASGQQQAIGDQSKERLIPGDSSTARNPGELSPNLGPTTGKSRKVSALFQSSPTSESKETRQPNKLKKKRMPSSTQPSANSSTHSLQNGEGSPRDAAFFTPLVTPGLGIQEDPLLLPQRPMMANRTATPPPGQSPRVGDGADEQTAPPHLENSQQPSESTLRAKSPGSVHSKSSVTDHSEQEQNPEASAEKAEKKRRWRFSSAPKKTEKTEQPAYLASPPLIGTSKPAGASSSTVGSWHKARKSMSNDIPSQPLEPVPSEAAQSSEKSEASYPKDKEALEDSERRGLFGRIRNKLQHAKEERKEKEAEKERAKSPPRNDADRNNSKHSLAAIANDAAPANGGPIEPSKHEASAQTDANRKLGQTSAASGPPEPISASKIEPVAPSTQADPAIPAQSTISGSAKPNPATSTPSETTTTDKSGEKTPIAAAPVETSAEPEAGSAANVKVATGTDVASAPEPSTTKPAS